ncbi:MAG TPA: CHAT domain-containing protein [Acidimicrobiales bacterium]|nr:CHAT domain-containing protein [Acidimicrobiales bacterium]
MASSAAVLDEIRTLTERRHRDPANVLRRVNELMEGAADPRVEAAGRLAAGLALQEVGRIKEAVASFRLGVAASVGHGLTDQEAVGRAQLAVALLNLGDATAAEQEVTRALAVAPASARGVVEMLWGLILQRTGRLDDSLAAFRRSLRSLGRFGDEVWMGRVRMNRGIVLAYKGELDAALDDFAFAERVAIEEQLPAMAAMAAHNTGFTHGRRGSLPDALAAYERAERAYAALETPHRFLAVLRADRCHVLLLAGLVHDAQAGAEAAVADLEHVDEVQLSECRVLLARTLLAQGAYDRAAAEATKAARSFQALRRSPWAAQARYVAIQAEVLAVQDRGLPPPEMLRRGRRIATQLEAQGWPVEALHVRTFVGRMALALGRPALARTELAQAAAARFRGTADLRAQAWHAAALLRLADGDTGGAKRALARGIAVVDEYRSTLGASELRANAASHGSELARLGVQLAIADGRPVEILRWGDRCRAASLHQVSVRPPPDESLAAALAELRRVRATMRQASLGGDGSPEAIAQASTLEEAVRNRTRQVRHAESGEVGRVDVRALKRALGSRTLVEYVTHEKQLYAVTVTRTRVRLHGLGPRAPVEQEKAYLLFALRRLLLGRSRGLTADVVGPTAARLDELLLAPLGLDAESSLVVVPTGLLHGLPWSCLPTVAGRDTTIAPSAAMWLRGAKAPAAPALAPPSPTARGARVTLVVGPQLPGGEAEIHQLSALYPTAKVLVGPDATTANVLEAMERADIVHLAAHGHFRADSPLFSSLLLADGPLTVYDIEQVRAVPQLVVLSACEAAVADVRAGDELLGAASALLALGVRSVVAPVFAVPDAATTPLMIALHRELLAGTSPGAALARATAGQDPAAVAAFLCIGCDDRADDEPAVD